MQYSLLRFCVPGRGHRKGIRSGSKEEGVLPFCDRGVAEHRGGGYGDEVSTIVVAGVMVVAPFHPHGNMGLKETHLSH